MGKKSRKNTSSTSKCAEKSTKGNSQPAPTQVPPTTIDDQQPNLFADNPGQNNNNPPASKFSQAPIEPGRDAVIRGLVSRGELNGKGVIIEKVLNNGRIKVQYANGLERETLSIKPENLEVRWNTKTFNGSNSAGGDVLNWGIEREECPICMDNIMSNVDNRSVMDCCGGKICSECWVKTQFTKQRDSCPLCRSDTSDGSVEAAAKKVRARAERGDANAMYNVGGYYDSGINGYPQNQHLARKWFKKAAECGETRAAHNLACSYRDGEGGPVDTVMAAKYFRMAAVKGHVQATTCLGIAYMTGDGVDRDLDEAKKWLQIGANAGDELAVQQLEMLDMMSQMSSMGSNFSCSSNPGSMMFSFGK